MTRLRETPKCIHCKEDTHYAKHYVNERDPIAGDTFSHWEPLHHECEGTRKMMDDIKDAVAKQMKKEKKKRGFDLGGWPDLPELKDL